MFDTINRDVASAEDGAIYAATPRHDPPRSVSVAAPAPARYGAARGINLPAALLIVAVHIALLAVAITARTVYVQKQAAKLEVVNLMPPAPPPPSQEEPTPPSRPHIVVPPPLVQVPTPPVQQIAVTDLPAPRPTTIIAPAAPPIAAALPPAPPATVQGGDLMAKMIAGKPPRYPVESRRKREQGTVVMTIMLGIDGRVATISIAQSSGHDRLDAAARDAVRNWRWEPMMRGGQPVQVRGTVEIPFVLQG